jgi:hypothetical protein
VAADVNLGVARCHAMEIELCSTSLSISGTALETSSPSAMRLNALGIYLPELGLVNT